MFEINTLVRDFVLDLEAGLLKKKSHSLVALQREWQALQDCQGFYVQEATGIDFTSNRIILIYYHDARSLLTFGETEQALFVNLLPHLIKAIAHCHQAGWVHGDIKPSNILYLPNSDTVKLIDFAAALPLGFDRTSLSSWQVTPQFASTEHRQGCNIVTDKDDWWALRKMLEQFARHPLTYKFNYQIRSIQNWLTNRIEK